MASSVDVVIVGAGPYGLSLAAHLSVAGVDFRIFGEPMGSWKHSMPAGMLLKSYPWATNLSDPASQYTVKHYCAERGMPYSDCLMALPVDTFISYGEAFQRRFVPLVERKTVISIDRGADGVTVVLNDGEAVRARRVIVAIGLTALKHMPVMAQRLSPELVSHSADYGPLDALDGKRVAVVGSGSSATDLAALLHERGTEVSLVARAGALDFASPPRPRGLIERAVAPMGAVGNGWTMAVCAHAPGFIRYVPKDMRLRLAYCRALGPLGGAFVRDRVIGKVPLYLGREIDRVKTGHAGVDLHLSGCDARPDVLTVDHIVFATGYRPDIGGLDFLGAKMAAEMRLIGNAPVLSHHYESSIRGVHFIGPIAASSFGPVSRFVHGARHPARKLARYLPTLLTRKFVPVIGNRLAASGVPQ
jgi:thioredoxin reductase